ncbi:MAG: hypothetical protein P4L31_01180 [Candidatus Babeliales bacterium]|nr:hypothetical protein [Candidatus Babeliales bacterium]
MKNTKKMLLVLLIMYPVTVKASQPTPTDAISDSDIAQLVDENQKEIDALEKYLAALKKDYKTNLILEERKSSLSQLSNFDKKHIQAYRLQCTQTAIIRNSHGLHYNAVSSHK